jgi:hypothetical protein
MASYPIVNQAPLSKAARNGRWGIGVRSRSLDQLPLPEAHEVVVYKCGTSYVVDDGRSRPTDSHIVDATNFSVIDMQTDFPVTAHVPIPSAGAGEFTVQATFLCTVRNPEDVVSSGLTDMQEALTHYLMRRQEIFHVSESFEFDQIATVRRNVESEIKAHVSVRPPRFRGMEVTLGNVQVLTPEELAKFEGVRRERRQEHLLAQERTQQQQYMDITRQMNAHQLQTQAERHSQELAEMQRQLNEAQELQQRRHEQLVAQIRQQSDQAQGRRQLEYDEATELQRARHEQFLAERRQDFEQTQEQQQLTHHQAIRAQTFDQAIIEAEKLGSAIGADRTEVPSLLAASAGERSLVDAADQLTQARQAAREAGEADALRRETWQREDEQVRWRADREDARMRYNLKIEELKAQLDIFSAGISRGLADAHTIDKLVGVIGGAVKQLESVSADVPSPGVPSGPSDLAPDGKAVYEAEVVDDPAPENSQEMGGEVPEDPPAIDGSPVDSQVPEDSDPEIREEDIGR